MRSLADRRLAAERALRGVAFAAMIVLAWRLAAGRASVDSTQVATTRSLDSALVRWSASGPTRATIDAEAIPSSRQRAWLVALRRTGTTLTWSTTDSSGGAATVEAGLLAGSPHRVTALAGANRDVMLSDDLGTIDSARGGPDGVIGWRVSPIGQARVALGRSTATSTARDSLVVRPVLVIGQAGWESRFVVTALEEDGWSIRAQLTVAPGAVVRQGPTVRIDTATLSAVVLLDSTSRVEASELSRFVREGGGVVASGPGTNHPALRRASFQRDAAQISQYPVSAAIGALLGPTPREGLSARSFGMRPGSVAIEMRGDAPVVVARRVESGRVIVTGYDDTWRVRMVPASESAPETHRTWWSSLVAGAAYARPVSRDVGPVDEAPLAATISALGPPTALGRSAPGRSWPWDAWLAAIAAAGLLAEWLSRRLRGVA